MKRIVLLINALTIGAFGVFAQCSSVPNNFEMKLTHLANHQLKIQMRYHANEVSSDNQLPTEKVKLDGLVFAISWPTSSNIKLSGLKDGVKPFSIVAADGLGTTSFFVNIAYFTN